MIFGQLSQISFVRNFSAGRLPRFVKRTRSRPPGISDILQRLSAGCKQSAGHAARRSPQEQETRKMSETLQGTGIGRGN
ncbi:hypothetical protein BN890_27270 [Bacteroides xylanisolvens SD CC 1b]|uniref:Uncharacterized protein n=1 Tax=Bacteroides xylanisolvens SD CC 1b TaxID=702447 RepID=W6P5Z9_9BACE|nr:hypothetical protein BN890_27270 [Bacteroides xylanisolvens SD CC 1b]